MDKFPLLCTLAVVMVFFAGACGIAGVQTMKTKDDSVAYTPKGAHVRSVSGLSRGSYPSVTAEKSGIERLDELLSPRSNNSIDSIMNTSVSEGISAESFNSIQVMQKERKVAMERKTIEVRGELLISF